MKFLVYRPGIDGETDAETFEERDHEAAACEYMKKYDDRTGESWEANRTVRVRELGETEWKTVNVYTWEELRYSGRLED